MIPSLVWPASWLPVLDKSRGSKAAEVQRVWDFYDDRLQFMSRDDALNLDGSSAFGDVSLAWMIWSSAVEAALADAYRFAGGPVPDSGPVLGRGVFRSRTVRLGGPEVRKAWRPGRLSLLCSGMQFCGLGPFILLLLRTFCWPGWGSWSVLSGGAGSSSQAL